MLPGHSFAGATTVLSGAASTLSVEPLTDGKHRLSVRPRGAISGVPLSCTTSYALPLIEEIYAAKGVYVCDEILREEDGKYVEQALRRELLGYVDPSCFAGRRVLDFGCGSGASTVVLSRLVPACEIVGVELQERLLGIARTRARSAGQTRVRFLASPSGDVLPKGLGTFDFIVLSAVYEHLLPHERRALLPRLWSHLAPGGILFLNQTPHRWSPIELHTTGLPLINFLPDGLAARAARRFSTRVPRDATWEELLRDGIRGATVGEILGTLRRCGPAALLAPRRGDRIDQWHGKLSPRHAWLKRSVWAALKGVKLLTGAEITPDLALAIRKGA